MSRGRGFKFTTKLVPFCLRYTNTMQILHPLVVLLLNGAHLHSEDLLHLRRQRLLHVLLDPTQQKGLQLLVQAGVARVPALAMVLLKYLPRVEPAQRECDTSARNTKNHFIHYFKKTNMRLYDFKCLNEQQLQVNLRGRIARLQ